MALAGAAMLVIGVVSSVFDAAPRLLGFLLAVIGGLVTTSAYRLARPPAPGDERARRMWWLIGLTCWLTTCGGVPLVAARTSEIRRPSESAAEAARRGRLVRRLTLVDSVESVGADTLRLLEAWIEREMTVRRAVFATATGRELVAVRIDAMRSWITLRVVTEDSVELPTLLQTRYGTPPYVANGVRHHPIGDFLQLHADSPPR